MRLVIPHLLALALAVSIPELATAASTSPSPAPSASSSQAAAIEVARSRIDAMLRTGHADPAWFSANFLAQIPASKVDEVIAGLTGDLGAYQGVEFTPDKFIAHFAKGTDDILIHLDADEKIDGLLFKPPAAASP
jgi:hypothetical protein